MPNHFSSRECTSQTCSAFYITGSSSGISYYTKKDSSTPFQVKKSSFFTISILYIAFLLIYNASNSNYISCRNAFTFSSFVAHEVHNRMTLWVSSYLCWYVTPYF